MFKPDFKVIWTLGIELRAVADFSSLVLARGNRIVRATLVAASSN